MFLFLGQDGGSNEPGTQRQREAQRGQLGPQGSAEHREVH